MISAIGGGSSMDTAKGIGIIVDNPEFEDVVSLEGGADAKKHAAFTIAVPTTADTAAEVTIAMLLLIQIKFANLFVLMLTIFRMLLLSIPI